MALPLAYNLRNVLVRWRVTLLATAGIALVVAVFTLLMSMSEGFAAALKSTGRDDNAMVVQRGSASELTSAVSQDARNMILVDDAVARGSDGKPLASWDIVVVMAFSKKSDGSFAHVTLRAVTPKAFEVRGGIRIVEGRPFTPGLDEVIVGRKIAERVAGLELGGTVKYQRQDLKIVGLFESDGAAFESEIWGDYDVFATRFEYGAGSSSLVFRVKDPREIRRLRKWMRGQPQTEQLQILPERRYYEEQAGTLAQILKGLAGMVALIMGIGAVFGAMNTMYAIVAARTREVGTLRALGFSRASVLASFVIESVTLALVAGAIGCLLAFPMHGFSTGTGQTQSFSEIAFAFRITPEIVISAVSFAVIMGIVGGLLPAFRAARLPITSALREG